ncbi:MAG: hypothetical protein O2910_07670, partial [Proteobacteria bacterium]|nr:hypothetical protein [Pseudomonadota bacterium]
RSRFNETLALERERPVLWAPVGLGAGIVTFFMWPTDPSYVLPGIVGAALAILFAITRSTWRLIPIALILAVIGFTAALVRTEWVAASVVRSCYSWDVPFVDYSFSLSAS